MSIIVSPSSSLPFTPSVTPPPPLLVNPGSPGPWLFTSAVSSFQDTIVFDFFFFFFFKREELFFFTWAFADVVSSYSFGSLPLLELAPLPESWRRAEILTTGASVWHQRASSERGTLPRCSTLTLRAAKLSDSTVSARLHIREKKNTNWMGKAAIRILKRGRGGIKAGLTQDGPVWPGGLARHERVRLPVCLQGKSALNRQLRTDKECASRDLRSFFWGGGEGWVCF